MTSNKKIKVLLMAPCLLFLTSVESKTVHCPIGCPLSGSQNTIIYNHIYALSNNPKTKFADWVAYEVNPVNYGKPPGRNWEVDPLIDSDNTLEEADYHGAYKANKTDRGHQVPLATFAGSQYWYEVNYLSNITPQKSNLNRGAWFYLEDAIRDAATFSSPLFVITGPLFDFDVHSLPHSDERHTVPSGYFKIIYNHSGYGVGFVMDQNTGKGENYCTKIVGLKNIASHVDNRMIMPGFKNSKKIREDLGC